MNNKNEKWLYIRVSTSKQDYDSQMEMIKNYFRANNITDNIEKLPKIEDFAKKRDKKMSQKNIMLKINGVPDGATLYCSELSRLGCNLVEVVEFVKLCEKHEITIIQCKDGTIIEYKTPQGKIMLTILALVADIELDFIKTRTKYGVKVAKERGVLFGKANPNYGKTKTQEQHTENIKRGNITRGLNKNREYVRTDFVAKFCDVLTRVRKEFKASHDKSKLLYEDFWKVKIRMSGEDYTEIIEKMLIYHKTKITYTQAQSKFHTIMKALRMYAENKNKLVQV